ncbi:MAG: rhodanese-like domain-containing protein [Candidatus Binataceae bacterium]
MAISMSAKALQGLMDSTALFALIDVREWGEFALGQILGARSVPRGQLEKYLPYLVPKRGVTVVLVCDDGRRSTRAAATAEGLGYSRVAVLDGGLLAWKAADGETYGGWSLTGKDYAEKLLVEENVPEISVAELHEWLKRDQKVCILDSRPLAEYRASHLPGARSAPIGQLALEAAALVPDPQTPVVANCAGRTRGIIAAHLLRRLGISNPVFALKGGTGAWRIAGWGDELKSGDDAPHPASDVDAVTHAEEAAARLAHEHKIGLLTTAKLRALHDAGEPLYILDVRLADEYAAGHIPSSRFCSGTQIQFIVDALVGVPNATVVTVCDGRARATIAASTLKGMGYRNVFVLDGGVNAWIASGYPVELGPPEEVDYGQAPWLAGFLQDFPPSLGAPRPLAVAGLEAARRHASLISAEDLSARLQAGAPTPVMIDLRGVGEFGNGHIPGARWLSRGWLDLKIAETAPDTGASLALYCRRGAESVLGAATLMSMGYRNVVILAGGFEAWKAHALPIEEGLGAQSQLEEIAIAEVGLFGTGKFGYSNERMARYLKDEEALGRRHRIKVAE